VVSRTTHKKAGRIEIGVWPLFILKLERLKIIGAEEMIEILVCIEI